MRRAVLALAVIGFIGVAALPGSRLVALAKTKPSLVLVVSRMSRREGPGPTGFVRDPETVRAWEARIRSLPLTFPATQCQGHAKFFYGLWWYRPRLRHVVFRARAFPTCGAVVFEGRARRGSHRTMERLWAFLHAVTLAGTQA